MAEPIALAALMIDAAVGWPAAVYRCVGHPVGLFATIINGCEGRWNRGTYTAVIRRIAGVATMALLIAFTGGVAMLIEFALERWLGSQAWPFVALLAAPGLAQHSLFAHVRAVEVALRTNGLEEARRAVAMIVGRDTHALDRHGVARAAIESLAESFCDGVTAPLFWLLLFGLPGIWIYKAVNTADSLIGHREERWRAFGWAAARIDDGMNWIPARIAGFLLCLCAGKGWRIMWRDARNHASPNAGWPEAAMAGALNIRLAGPISYDGIAHEKPWIGDGRVDLDAADIGRALRAYVHACLGLWMIAGVAAWAL